MIFVKNTRFMFKTQILADKLTHLTDARYFAARGVDIICFSIMAEEGIEKSVMSINAIKAWIEGPKIFLRPGFCGLEDILYLSAQIEAEAIVLPFLSEPIDKKLIPCRLFLEIIIESRENLNLGLDLIHQMNPDGLICEVRNEEALKASWFLEFINDVSNSILVYIKLGFEMKDQSYLTSLSFTGIAIDGGMEEKIGLKSFDDIDAWLDEMEL